MPEFPIFMNAGPTGIVSCFNVRKRDIRSSGASDQEGHPVMKGAVHIKCGHFRKGPGWRWVLDGGRIGSPEELLRAALGAGRTAMFHT